MPSGELPVKSSVDTSTSYMGLRLRHPFMAGASPLSAFLTTMVEKLVAWMEWNKISSVEEMRGRVSLKTAADPGDFERANYIRTLHRLRGGCAHQPDCPDGETRFSAVRSAARSDHLPRALK
jgi:hypothetical protein